jgi:hypothetical protein
MASRCAAVLSLTLLLAAPARAQVSEPPAPAAAGAAQTPELSRLGLGVSFAAPGPASTIYVPMDFGALRVEWEVGYLEAHTGDSRATAGHLGVGVFRLVPTFPGVQAYYGARLQYEWLSAGGEDSNGPRFAAALGGEWLPVPAVAFGVEGQLGYSDRPASVPAVSGSVATRGFATSALVFLRVFLGGGSTSAAAGPQKPPPPTRCKESADCTEGGICFDGYCRR